MRQQVVFQYQERSEPVYVAAPDLWFPVEVSRPAGQEHRVQPDAVSFVELLAQGPVPDVSTWLPNENDLAAEVPRRIVLSPDLHHVELMSDMGLEPTIDGWAPTTDDLAAHRKRGPFRHQRAFFYGEEVAAPTAPELSWFCQISTPTRVRATAVQGPHICFVEDLAPQTLPDLGWLVQASEPVRSSEIWPIWKGKGDKNEPLG